MTDFRKMAQDARATEDEAERLRLEAHSAERLASQQRFDKSVGMLKTYVLPILEEAASAFSLEGVAVKITKSYEKPEAHYLSGAEIRFQCLGPERRSDKHRFETKAAFFTVSENKIEVGMNEYASQNRVAKKLGSAVGAQCEQLVSQAIELILKEYQNDLRQWRISGNDRR